jgi:predicted flap endonuclease-1-like 5' DNA nuclease
MAEEKQDKYARLLREGKTEEATKVAQEMRGSEVAVETQDSVSEHDRFTELKGVGDELADEMVEEFGDYDSFAENAAVEDLEPISGIGEKSAESLLEQVE